MISKSAWGCVYVYVVIYNFSRILSPWSITERHWTESLHSRRVSGCVQVWSLGSRPQTRGGEEELVLAGHVDDQQRFLQLRPFLLQPELFNCWSEYPR